MVGNRPSIILGAFNCRVNWKDRKGDGQGRELPDFIKENLLTQWVREPTRGNIVLNLVFTTEDNIVTNLSVDQFLG